MKRFIAFAFIVLSAAMLRSEPAGTQIPLDTFPMSAALSPDGKFLLVLNSGSKPPSISVLSVSPMREIQRVPAGDAWLGLTFASNGRLVYAGGGSRGKVSEFTFSAAGELKPSREFDATPAGSFIGDVAVSPDGRLVYAADVFHDSIVVFNPQSGRMIERYKTGRRPYRILFHPDGRSFWVSSWADGTVYLHDAASGEQLDRIRLGPHTTDMVLSDRKLQDEENPPRYRLFVAASNTNSVFAVGISDANRMTLMDSINVSLMPRQPLGMTPSGVALNADQTELYVTCADANAVGVVDISAGRGVLSGFVPVGAYPTAARGLADGRVVVLNGGSGTISAIDPLTDEAVEQYDRAMRALVPVPDEPQLPAIEHVLYVVRDGRGASQANESKLAGEFVRFDNFSNHFATIPELLGWATAGIAPDFTRKLVARRGNPEDYEGEPANAPPAGYLWSNVLAAGLSLRNYGFFVTNRPMPGKDGLQIDGVRDPALKPVTDTRFRGSDPNYPDTDRVRAFLEDLQQFESSGRMPRLMMMRLGGDDEALGMIVEAVSKSKFWPSTAIFVTAAAGEDSPGQVDSNRSTLLVVSPFTRRGTMDHTMYNQSSVLRTIELLLGLRPMTQFDAGAQSLATAFSTTPNPAAYTAVPRSPASRP